MTPRSLKFFLAKPKIIKAIFPPGFGDAALQEITHMFNHLDRPPKFLPCINLLKNEVVISDVHMVTAMELLLKARCLTDIRLVVGQGKVVTKSAFARVCEDIPWTYFLNPSMSVKIKVNSIASQLFHENALKEILSDLLQKYAKEILYGEKTNESTAVFVELNKNKLTISISLAGEPLYKRGYKQLTASAPLREDIAACCFWKIQSFVNANSSATSDIRANNQKDKQTLRGKKTDKLNLDGVKQAHNIAETANFPTSLSSLKILLPFSGTGTFYFEYLMQHIPIPPVLLGRSYAIQQMAIFRSSLFHFLEKKIRERFILNFTVFQTQCICIDNSEKAMQALLANRNIFSQLLNVTLSNIETYLDDFFAVNVSQLLDSHPNSSDLFIAMNPPYGLRLNQHASTNQFYKKIAHKINEIIAMFKNRGKVYGFILCPTEETWQIIRKEVNVFQSETYHFNQGGLDIRVYQFISKSS